MTGARKLAADFILPRIKPGMRVLDVGCGDGWLSVAAIERGAEVVSVDQDIGRAAATLARPYAIDLRGHWPLSTGFDLVCAVYSLQHLLGSEARAWSECRRMVKPEGRLLVVGRHMERCDRETNRADPLNGYDYGGLLGLCLATGFEPISIDLLTYEGDAYERPARDFKANAFTLEARPT